MKLPAWPKTECSLTQPVMAPREAEGKGSWKLGWEPSLGMDCWRRKTVAVERTVSATEASEVENALVEPAVEPGAGRGTETETEVEARLGRHAAGRRATGWP